MRVILASRARRPCPSARTRPRRRAPETCPAPSPSCRGCAARSCRPSPCQRVERLVADRGRACGSTASASASAATFWNSTMLLMSFIAWPAPATPQRTTSVAKCGESRLHARENVLGAADHDEELTLLRGHARARHRRVDEVHALRLEARSEVARQRHRRRARVEHVGAPASCGHRLPGPTHTSFTSVAPGSERNTVLAALGDFAHAGGGLHAVRIQALERRRRTS